MYDYLEKVSVTFRRFSNVYLVSLDTYSELWEDKDHVIFILGFSLPSKGLLKNKEQL